MLRLTETLFFKKNHLINTAQKENYALTFTCSYEQHKDRYTYKRNTEEREKKSKKNITKYLQILSDPKLKKKTTNR